MEKLAFDACVESGYAMRVLRAALITWLIGFASLLTSVAGETPASTSPPTLPFRVGEKLHYKIFWGILEVGTATLEVKELIELGGHPAYHIVGTIMSNSFISKIYPVKSTVETFLDADGLYSRSFVEDRREGRHQRQRKTTLDYDRKSGEIITPKKTKTFDLPGPVQDGFSTIYFLRTQPLRPNTEQKFAAISSDKVGEVTMRSHEKKMISILHVGRFPAIRVVPSSNFETIFAREGGGMTVWVTDDERKIPVIMIAKIAVGSVKAELMRIEGAIPTKTTFSGATAPTVHQPIDKTGLRGRHK